LKEDIRHVDSSLEKILQLKPVTYRYRTDREEKQQIGFIAQDVEPLFPEVVETDDEGLKSMIYSNLIAPVVKAIQELNSKIDKLFATQEKEAKEVDRLKRDLARQRIEHEQKVKKLESQNEQLEKRLEAIEKLIQEKTQQ
jgi:outer membrane murein-binding lipoprotein Lpp